MQQFFGKLMEHYSSTIPQQGTIMKDENHENKEFIFERTHQIWFEVFLFPKLKLIESNVYLDPAVVIFGIEMVID